MHGVDGEWLSCSSLISLESRQRGRDDNQDCREDIRNDNKMST